MFPRYARLAKVLGTVSEFSKGDLPMNLKRRTSGVFERGGRCVCSGHGHGEDPCPKIAAGGHPYFIFVGSFHPRKNLGGVLKAFEHYVEQGGQWHLVMVGEAMWSGEAMTKGASDRVHFTGRLNDAKLVEAVSSASGMVFVPWFEGFGVPIVEAMSCGVPVIASEVTSLPEVCGGLPLPWWIQLTRSALPKPCFNLNRMKLQRRSIQEGNGRRTTFMGPNGGGLRRCR